MSRDIMSLLNSEEISGSTNFPQRFGIPQPNGVDACVLPDAHGYTVVTSSQPSSSFAQAPSAKVSQSFIDFVDISDEDEHQNHVDSTRGASFGKRPVTVTTDAYLVSKRSRSESVGPDTSSDFHHLSYEQKYDLATFYVCQLNAMFAHGFGAKRSSSQDQMIAQLQQELSDTKAELSETKAELVRLSTLEKELIEAKSLYDSLSSIEYQRCVGMVDDFFMDLNTPSNLPPQPDMQPSRSGTSPPQDIISHSDQLHLN